MNIPPYTIKVSAYFKLLETYALLLLQIQSQIETEGSNSID